MTAHVISLRIDSRPDTTQPDKAHRPEGYHAATRLYTTHRAPPKPIALEGQSQDTPGPNNKLRRQNDHY